MGCGSTDITTLTWFFDLPYSGHTIIKHLKEVEPTIGQVKLMKKNESEVDALAEGIDDHDHRDEIIT